MKKILSSLTILALLIIAPYSFAQYGDPGPPPAPDTPRAEDPREIEQYDPAFAPNTVLDAPDPALDQDSVISQPESFNMDPGPGGIVTEPENVEVAPGGVYTEDRDLPMGAESAVETDPLIREPRPLVEQPDPLVKQPPALVEQPDPLVEQPEPLVPRGGAREK